MALLWNSPESTPLVDKGKECQYWIATKNDKGKIAVFMAYYQNRPIDENDCDDCLYGIDGDLVASVGWVDAKQHVDFDGFWEAFSFNDNYKLLGWADYVPPEFTGVDKALQTT